MAKKAVKRVNTPKKATNAAAAAAASAAEKEKKAVDKKVETVEKDKKVEKATPVKKDVKVEKPKEKATPVKTDKTEKVEKIEKSNTDGKEQTDKDKKTTHDDSANLSVTEDSATEEVAEEQSQDQSVEEEEENENNESVDEKKERAESPLNILIGEEEENLLLNSGDEQAADEEGDGGTDEAVADEKNDDKKDDDESGQIGETQPNENNEPVESKENVKTESMAENSNAADLTSSSANATANDNDQSKTDEEKNKNNKSNNPGRSLWVTNLLPSTRAQELKHLLSRYGKVIGAKVVQSSRHPRTRCYGYVTMETRGAADLCIEKLNNTELKGQIIRVAKVRPEHSLPLKSVPETENVDKSKTTPSKQDEKSAMEKKKGTPVSGEKKKDDKSVDKKENSKEPEHSRSSSRKERSLQPKAPIRPKKKPEVLTFDKIREERDRHRQRERERAEREEEKRRREIQRAREIERRQREESQRLEREREKLRIERERLDRQRQEILRLERERQKLEREKLEQEKQELRRQQLRLEEARRPVKRPASTTTSTYRRETTGYTDDRKRETREDRHYEEAPPPPRFEVAPREPVREIPREKKEIEKDYKPHISYSKHSEEYSKRSDYKREFPTSERHPGGSHIVHGANNGGSAKYESSTQYVNRDREIREPYRREPIPPKVGPPPNISADARYNERPTDRSPVSYRGVRDERDRRPIADHHSKSDIRSSRDHRYAEPVSSSKDSSRYREGNSWHSGGPSPTQPFSGIGGPNNSSRDSWSKSENWRAMESGSNDRWVGNSSSRMMLSGSSGVPGTLYSTGNSSSLNCPPPPGSSSYAMDRFDNYKSMSNTRKY